MALEGILLLFVLFFLAYLFAVFWVYSDATRNSPHPAALWALVVFFAPVVGLVLYLIIGRDQYGRYDRGPRGPPRNRGPRNGRRDDRWEDRPREGRRDDRWEDHPREGRRDDRREDRPREGRRDDRWADQPRDDRRRDDRAGNTADNDDSLEYGWDEDRSNG